MYMDTFFNDAACIVYDAVLQTLSNHTKPKLNCTKKEVAAGSTLPLHPDGAGGLVGGAGGEGMNRGGAGGWGWGVGAGRIGKVRRTATGNYTCAWASNRSF
jgi:hypothetical protein